VMAGLLTSLVGCKCVCPVQKSTDGQLVILQEPQSQTVLTNSPVTFSVVAMHVGPPSTNAITYQWRKNGSVIVGATSSTFSIASAQFTDVGTYDVVVTGSTLTSNPAFLSVYSLSANGGTLSAAIDSFVTGSPSCASGFNKYYSFYPTNSPFGFVPPTGTTKLGVDTFDTRNGTFDTAVEVFKRPSLSSVCCNDNAATVPPGFSALLSQCTNVTTVSTYNYRFGLYVKGTVPTGTQFYLNFLFY
jgi:hypothetical protein